MKHLMEWFKKYKLLNILYLNILSQTKKELMPELSKTRKKKFKNM